MSSPVYKVSVGVFGIIVNERQEVLLLHRNDYDLWNLPGGGMEAGETFEQALAREIKEETGLVVMSSVLFALYSKPNKSDITVQFLCTVQKGDVVLDRESSRYMWCALNDVPKNITRTGAIGVERYKEDSKRVYVETLHGKGSVESVTGRKPLSNYAFIDGQNVHLGMQSLGWRLDYYRLRHYLRSKFGVEKAFIFLGYIHKHKDLYEHLRSCGFELVFKSVARDSSGNPKGNVDVDLTLFATNARNVYERAVIITSDGDFAPLVSDLERRGKFKVLISPTKRHCSYLLRKEVGRKVVYLADIAHKVTAQTKRRAADR